MSRLPPEASGHAHRARHAWCSTAGPDREGTQAMATSTRSNARDEASDEALMARYADGDVGAFDELFRRFEPRAYAYFLKRTHSSERAQDLYQELFLRIHRARDSYDAARAFAPWFFQIAHRLWVDDQRRAYRAHEVPIGDHEPSARRRDSDDLAGRQQLAQILRTLSQDERYVLVASKIEGIAYPQLAAELGKSVDAIKQMASRALRRIRPAPLPAAACSTPRAR
jgi:RNA polymerase sigma-70 factor, ECF subfamily